MKNNYGNVKAVFISSCLFFYLIFYDATVLELYEINKTVVSTHLLTFDLDDRYKKGCQNTV